MNYVGVINGAMFRGRLSVQRCQLEIRMASIKTHIFDAR
jgi:hypothetical protein